MGQVYLPTWMLEFHGFHVGKYTRQPWIKPNLNSGRFSWFLMGISLTKSHHFGGVNWRWRSAIIWPLMEIHLEVARWSWHFWWQNCWGKPGDENWREFCYLVVSTSLKNISQNGNFPQIWVNIAIFWNHHPVCLFRVETLSFTPQKTWWRKNFLCFP